MTGHPRPNFLVVGAMKAGTSTLHAYLEQHPDVFVPASEPADAADRRRRTGTKAQAGTKELHFFDRAAHHRRDHEAAYLANFTAAGGHTAIGEATPSYGFTPGAASAIAEFDPGMRLLMMVRDPVDRAISHIAHRGRLSEHRGKRIRVGGVWEELAADLQEQPGWLGRSFASGRRGYHARGLYHEQLERLHRHFPSDQVLVIRLEDFVGDPQTELDRVTDHLGVARHRFTAVEPVNRWSYDPPPEAVYQYLAAYYLLPNRILTEGYGIRTDDWRTPSFGVDFTDSPVIGTRNLRRSWLR